MELGYSQDEETAWQRLPFSLTIADLEQEDEPLVFVNRSFEAMTGYSSAAAVGRNCRFLQGERTDAKSVEKLRKAIKDRTDVDVTLLNYRANGETFWNRLFMGPLKDPEGSCRYFVGIQCDLGSDQEPAQATEVERQLLEVQHRVKNHLSMIVGMIRIQACRKEGIQDEFNTLARRVEALQLLYQEMDHAGAASATDKVIPLGAYLGRITSALNHLDGRQGIKVNFEADTVPVPVETAARLGLILSEILTNALQHAFEGRSDGVITVRVKLLSHDLLRISMEDDGVGLPEDCDWPNEGNLGARIVTQLVRGLDGTLGVRRGEAGTLIHLDTPLDRQAAMIEGERE